ncbi:MAG: biopolymer transporter ExbD, partial [Simkaniaceae bacterium]|nr:biopolymer transporter ExbD [Simkaniaceae bacterium]
MIPDDELAPTLKINFAPMVDFLFLTLTVFAVLAVSRSPLFDSKIELATNPQKTAASTRSSHTHTINLSIDQNGHYKLITETAQYIIQDLELLRSELRRNYLNGTLPADTALTHVLLHIDKKAHWDSIAP